MTRKERILATLNGEKTDVVPFHADLTIKMRNRLAEYYGIEKQMVEDHIGNHFLYLNYHEADTRKDGKYSLHESGSFSIDGRTLDDNNIMDEFGVIWDNDRLYDSGDWGMIASPVKNLDISNYEFPDGSAPGRFNGVEDMLIKNPDRFNVLIMTGLFDVAWHITGFQDFLMSMAMEDKSFVNYMLDKALEFNLGIIEQTPAYIDGIRFLEDWGLQKGLMMGIELWRELFKPRLKIMYAAVRNKGMTVMSHSCGDNTELIGDLIEIKSQVYDPVQPEAMDLPGIKKKYGKDIVLFGGLGSQSTIPLGTAEEVVEEAKTTLDFMNAGGNYILGPAGSIPTEAPIENVAALVDFYKTLV